MFRRISARLRRRVPTRVDGIGRVRQWHRARQNDAAVRRVARDQSNAAKAVHSCGEPFAPHELRVTWKHRRPQWCKVCGPA